MAKKKSGKSQPRTIVPFNPLDKRNLGESVAEALMHEPLHMFPPSEAFIGAGVYAIYFHGDYPVYGKLKEWNETLKQEIPIYVGKAVPAGARKGGFGLDQDPGMVLYNRLKEHARSIDSTDDITSAEFRCRFLVTEDIWIPLAEAMLIETFGPLWNTIVDGFGNHDPGKGRYEQKRSNWDMLHPGRSWAEKCIEGRQRESIIRDVDAYLSALIGRSET